MPQEAEYDTRPSHSLQPSAQDQCGSVSVPQAASLALHAAPSLVICGCVNRVPNAMPGRDSVNIEIFGMAGVPEGAAPGVTVPVGEQPTL